MKIGYCTQCKSRVTVSLDGGCPLGHSREYILESPSAQTAGSGAQPFAPDVAPAMPSPMPPATVSDAAPPAPPAPPATAFDAVPPAPQDVAFDAATPLEPFGTALEVPVKAKRKKSLVALVALVGILLVAGMGAGAYFLFSMTPAKAMAQTVSAMTEVETVGVRMEVSGQVGGQSMNVSGEGFIRMPSDSQMRVRAEIASQTIEFDQLTSGDALYVRYDGYDQWGTMDMGQALAEGSMNSSPMDALRYLSSVVAIERYDREVIDGVECNHFGYAMTGQDIVDLYTNEAMDAKLQEAVRMMYADAELHVDVWTGVDDSLVRQQSLTMEQMGEGADAIQTMMYFSDYNGPVDIQVPKDAVPFAELITNMSQAQ